MNKVFSFFYKAFFTIIIIFATIGVTLDALSIEFNLNSIIIIIIITFFSLSLFLIFDKRPLFLLITIMISFFVFFIYREYYNNKLITFIDSSNNFFVWLLDLINNKTVLNENFFNLFLILLTFTLSLFIYITIFKFNIIYPVVLIITSFFLYRWFWYQNSAFNYYYIFIFAVFSLYTFGRFKIKFINWKKENKDDTEYKSKYLFIYSLIITITIISILFILPKDNSPIKWRWMDDKFQKNFPQVTEWRNNFKKSKSYGKDLEFDLTFTPYQSNEEKLGGNIDINNKLVMEVESDRPLYLKGIVKDEYTGTHWKSSKDEVEKYEKNNTIDIREKKLNSYTELEYKIEHINLTTSTIFSSYIPVKVNYKEAYYSSDEYEIYTNKVILSEEDYSVEAMIPYFDKSKVNEAYEKDKKYLKLPDTVTNRTKNLALGIAKNASNDYKKMIKLQNYLRENYSYSLTPGNEKYDDFVDNFLFEKSEGYCTYFASSLAVMARSLNIPTRYIEGFITGDKNEEGKYEVYSENAHAWVEAYINGYGWMVFEATPAYNVPNNLSASIEEKTEEDSISNEVIQNKENKEKQLQEMLEEEFNSKEEIMENNSNKNNPKKSKNILLQIMFWIILIFIILLIVIFLYIQIKKIVDNKKIKQYNYKQKIKYYYKKILNILFYLDYKKELGQTDKEFIEKIDINDKINLDLRYFINIYLRIIYSDQKLSYKDENIIRRIIEVLEKEIKNRKGTLKYIIQKVYNRKSV